ncbi:reverse transcriptase domain-containing protein [Tanacetum coccineum]
MRRPCCRRLDVVKGTYEFVAIRARDIVLHPLCCSSQNPQVHLVKVHVLCIKTLCSNHLVQIQSVPIIAYVQVSIKFLGPINVSLLSVATRLWGLESSIAHSFQLRPFALFSWLSVSWVSTHAKHRWKGFLETSYLLSSMEPIHCIYCDASFPPNLALWLSLESLPLQHHGNWKMSIGMAESSIIKGLSHCFFLRLQQVKSLEQTLREMQDQLWDSECSTDDGGRDSSVLRHLLWCLERFRLIKKFLQVRVSSQATDTTFNPNDQQKDFETPINFDSDEEDKESTPQPKTQNPKPVKETPLPKPYKLKILYPQRLRKEKMEAQYGKFLDMIRAVRINVPLIGVLAGMPNYGKFLKELISNKHKIEQISAAFLSDDPKQTNFGASINLMPYSLYAKLSLKNLKPTKVSVRLADTSFQYPVGIAKNILVEVGKFTFPADFVILEMEEDSKVSLILGRPFLHTADAVIRVKQKQLNLGVGTERMTFNIDSAMKRSYSNDDTCFSIDVIDEILEEDFDALLDEGSKILHSIEGPFSKINFAEFMHFHGNDYDENSGL